jgi:predicted RNA-binding Zn ribbon-like protein
MASADDPGGERFGLRAAPGGLRLVQDLINTSLVGHRGTADDLLADLATANSWLDATLAAWSDATARPSPRLDLHGNDLAPLRRLREALRRSLRATAAHADPLPADQPDAAGDPIVTDLRLSLEPDGRVRTHPVGPGTSGLAALVGLELLLVERTDLATRLKTCAAPRCGACFYDSSPNRVRAWHNTKLCANVPNLRASRARRKALDPA